VYRGAGAGISVCGGLCRWTAERLAGQHTSPAHPDGGDLGVVAKLLRYSFGTAQAAEFTDGSGDGMLHLSRAGLIRALQPRYEEGIGPQGADAGMLHR
jgi:hypothetical protein